jgi:hypothetical protein
MTAIREWIILVLIMGRTNSAISTLILYLTPPRVVKMFYVINQISHL